MNRIERERKLWDSTAASYDKLVSRYFGETYREIIEHVIEDASRAENLLDAAAGTGILATSLSKYVAHITAIDLSPAMIQVAKEKAGYIDFSVGDICHLGFPDKTFDVVIASNVLHFLYEPARAMSEMKRVLVDKGKMIVPTFCHAENLSSKFYTKVLSLAGQAPVNKWSRKTFIEFVETNGFEITRRVDIDGKIPLIYLVAVKALP